MSSRELRGAKEAPCYNELTSWGDCRPGELIVLSLISVNRWPGDYAQVGVPQMILFLRKQAQPKHHSGAVGFYFIP